MKNTLALAGAIAAASCVSVDLDPNEKSEVVSTGPLVEFDPGKSIIPFPNNLLIDRATGTVNLPAQCGESATGAALRQLVLNKLDGFGTFKSAMRITLTEAVDMTSLTDNIVMYRRATGAVPVDPAAATKIPLVFIPGKTTRFSADCASNSEVDSLTIVPRVPLSARSTYVVAVLKGVKTASGTEFGASSTWGLVRQKANPVTVENGEIISERTPLSPAKPEDKATLLGLDLLWKAHAQAMGFAEAATGKARSDISLAWEFTTQTTTAPLDPSVAGTPAANLPKAAISGVTIIASNSADAVTHIAGVLEDPATFNAPAGVCAAPPAGIGCASIGAVHNGVVTAPIYQSPSANPLGGAAPPVPGPWSSPVAPIKLGDGSLQLRITIPDGAMPAGGWPTAVFGHGLGGNRLYAYLLAPQLARAGFATVAIDFVAHGQRAVQINNAAAAGCATPSTYRTPQCYAPFLSTNLAATRDNIRQTVLDMQTVIQSLKLCTSPTACGGLQVNPAKIGYIGISLGGIVGAVLVATASDIKAAVLNVPGAGLVDILENTDTLPIRCSLVDGLIDAGIVMGAKSNPPTYTMGACTTPAWRAQPGYQSFANIARWILDSSDNANFASRLAAPPRRFLIQKVNGDTVVPNIATDQLGGLTGFTMPTLADRWTATTTTASATITTNPLSNKWVQYNALPVSGADPANTFAHGSLLGPANTGIDGRLGTARMQTDALTYLNANVNN